MGCGSITVVDQFQHHDMKTRIVTFNVCGIKGLLSRTAQWVPDRSLETMFAKLEADIICFQELKVQLSDMPKDLGIVPGFNGVFTTVRGRPGYDGVGIYVKNSIRIYKAEEGLTGWLRPKTGQLPYRENPSVSICPQMYPDGMSERDGLRIDAQQARAISLDLGVCVVIGLYCPADSQGNMSEYKDEFFQLLDWRVHKLREQGREVIVFGDLNVAREPVDSATIVEELTKLKQPIDRDQWMFGTVPRSAVNGWVVNEKFEDTTRKFHLARTKMFSCWDQQKNCRPANFGSRVDYILSSPGLNCVGSDILPDLVGSDHCPVYADFEFGELESQGGHSLPPLARRIVDKWPQTLSMFLKRTKSPRSESPNREGDNEGMRGHQGKRLKSEPAFYSESTHSKDGDSKDADSKNADSKDADSKDIDSKDIDSKDVDLRDGDSKDADSKDIDSKNALSKDAMNANSTSAPISNAPLKDENSKDSKDESLKQSSKPAMHEPSEHKKPSKTDANEPSEPATSSNSDHLKMTQPNIESEFKREPHPRPHVTKAAPASPKKPKQGSISSMFGAKNPQWQKVQKRQEPPLCNHGQPCIMMQSKKPPRKGQWFWICSRPMGGKINTSLDHRCKTFIWDSDRRIPPSSHDKKVSNGAPNKTQPESQRGTVKENN